MSQNQESVSAFSTFLNTNGGATSVSTLSHETKNEKKEKRQTSVERYIADYSENSKKVVHLPFFRESPYLNQYELPKNGSGNKKSRGQNSKENKKEIKVVAPPANRRIRSAVFVSLLERQHLSKIVSHIHSTRPQSSLKGLHLLNTVSKGTGTIRAFLIGINYLNTDNELSGCINDVKSIQEVLFSYGALPENVILCTDLSSIKPTRRNIVEGWKQLFNEAQDGDRLVIWYSGHGGEVRDTTGTEKSGRMQIIFPVDFETSGDITDDQFYNLYNQLLGKKPNVALFCGWDACHSGTFSDCEFQYSPNSKLTALDFVDGSKERNTKASVRAQSGCLDSQTSADVSGKTPHGAFTAAFLKLLLTHRVSPLSTEQFVLGVNQLLRTEDFVQRSELTSSRILNLDAVFEFP